MFEIGIFLLVYSLILAYYLLKSPKPPSEPPSLFKIYTAGKNTEEHVTLEEVKGVLIHKSEEELKLLSSESSEEVEGLSNGNNKDEDLEKLKTETDEKRITEIIELDEEDVEEEKSIETFEDIMSLSNEKLKSLSLQAGNKYIKEIYEIFNIFKEDFSDPGWRAFLRSLYFLMIGQDDSSVVSQRGKDVKKLDDVYKLLGKVSLSQHTRNVVHLMAVEVQKQSAIKAHICEQYLLSAIMHDLGKSDKILETFGDGMYRLVDHSMLVDAFLAEFYEDIDDKTSRIKEEIKQAVLLHHQSSKVLDNDLALALKKADQEARKKEIEELTHEMPLLKEVLDKESLQHIILQDLNNINKQCSGKTCIFSVKNYILANKKYLLNKIKEYLKENNKLVREIYSYDENEFESAVCDFLIENNFTTKSLLEHYVSVKRKNPAKKTTASMHFYSYWALILESFGVLSSKIEEKKPPSLKLFIDVELRKRSI